MAFWQDVPFDERVNLFDLSHIGYLFTVVLLVAWFATHLSWVKAHWTMVRRMMIGVSLVQVVVLYSWSAIELGFSLEAGLPIHLCRMATFLGLYFLFTEDTRVFHALYYMSAFAIVAIVYPVNVHPIYTHVIGWSYQVSHGMILLVWMVGVFQFGYRPTYRVLNRVVLWFFVITLIVWRFNYWVGDGEYLYLRSDVNRPFFKNWPDLMWIAFTMLLSYGVMWPMTYVWERKRGIERGLEPARR